MYWAEFKEVAAHLLITKDALHVYGAFMIQVLAAAALRRPISSWLPWACVLGAELLNEFLDIYFGNELSVQGWQLLGAEHDVLNTMLLPTALLFLCRYANGLFHKPAPAVVAPARVDGLTGPPASGSGVGEDNAAADGSLPIRCGK